MAQPDFIPQAFAENGDKNSLPDSSTTAASWSLGFPPITALPLASGGIAPDRKDFNAVLYALTAHAVFAQCGGIWTYSKSADYVPPALVHYGGCLYYCVGANGASSTVVAPDEDTTGSYWQELPTGGVGWLAEPLPTRTGDNSFTVEGDQTAKFPRGKLLRFNGDDAYLCRVLGDPAADDEITSITVWFDAAAAVPEEITKLERYPLIPQCSARSAALVTATQYSEEEIELLLSSYCYSSVTVKEE